MAYPHNLETKVITGNFADLYEDHTTGEVKSRPREGYVYITPFYDKIKVIDQDIVVDLYELQRQRVKMVDGSFTAEVLVTNQSNISPSGDENGNGWTYKFEMSWIPKESANIPINSDSDTTIDINNWFSSPERPGLIVTYGDPGKDGRGIDSITANGATATFTYTDGTTTNIPLPDTEGGYQYVHNQISAESEWYVEHNLNRYVTSCFVTYGQDLNNLDADQVFANWTNVDKNHIIIHHGKACSGKAVI